MPILHTHERGMRGSSEAIYISHGLFGSGRNWGSIASSLSDQFYVICADARNHGESIQSSLHSTEVMAEDILDTLDHLNLKETIAMGHSMGGLSTMTAASKTPSRFRAIIIVDILPKVYQVNYEKEFELLSMDLSKFESRKEIESTAKKILPNPMVRQFLLTNISGIAPNYCWQLNTPALKTFHQVAPPPQNPQFEKPALLIYGKESEFIKNKNLDCFKKIFPNSTLIGIENAGHWLHFTHREEFLLAIRKWINQIL